MVEEDAAVTVERAPVQVPRRGRPPRTSARQIEIVAVALFVERGFENTTIELIADAAGVSRSTFFRYFDSKSDLLWREFDAEAQALRVRLARAPQERPAMDAVREAILAENRLQLQNVPDLRARLNLIASVPELGARGYAHHAVLEAVVGDFVARRTGRASDSIFALAVGRATVAVCRTAYDRWSGRADSDLIGDLDAALRALADGFAGPLT